MFTSEHRGKKTCIIKDKLAKAIMPREIKIIASKEKIAIMGDIRYFRHAVVPNLKIVFHGVARHETHLMKNNLQHGQKAQDKNLIKNIAAIKRTVCKRDADVFRCSVSTAEIKAPKILPIST